MICGQKAKCHRSASELDIMRTTKMVFFLPVIVRTFIEPTLSFNPYSSVQKALPCCEIVHIKPGLCNTIFL